MTDQPDGRVIQLRPAVSGELAQPAVAEAEAAHPWLAPVPRRPVIPQWLREPDSRSAAARWWFSHVGHKWAFHLVRLPRYILRLAWHSPRGLGRFCHHGWAWVFDREGHPLRLGAVEAKDPKAYAALARIRKDRVRQRLTVLACGTVAASAAVVLLSLAWRPVQWFLLAAAVMFLGWLGRKRDEPYFEPAVVAPHAERLTPDVITRALGALGLAGINQVLRDGGFVNFVSPVHRDGPGWRADIDLPYGVTATDILDRREKLASGLRRPLGCVWPEPVHDEHAGRLMLWVGDETLSRGRQPAWPLAKAGRADMFKPVPFGTDNRRRPVALDLMFNNLLIGAIPRQGKTFSLRLAGLAAALDPIAELRCFELKGTGDLECLRKVAHHYGCGPDDDTIEAALSSLREVHGELERRAKVIRSLPKLECPESKVTPQLAARKSLRLHPVVYILDEAQEAYTHPEHGAAFAKYSEAVIKRGPALGVIILIATQRPDAQSLPVGVRANVSLRFCLRVMDQPSNDMVLGTSAYKTGIRATLMTISDKGCGWLVGASETAQVVRAYNVDGPAADKICERARAVRLHAGTLTGQAAGEQPDDDERNVSLLADVLEVMPEPEQWLDTVAGRLESLRPLLYASWDGRQLGSALRLQGITPKQLWRDGANRNGIRRADVQAVLEGHDES